ncbi:MAG: SDR family oxidoreductase [Actinomycetota bacterium]
MSRPLALVTGAASGIGAAVAERLVRRGHRVITVDRNAELADAAAVATGSDAIPVACDVGDRAALADLRDRIEGEWADDLMVVVANAGIIRIGEVDNQTADDLDATIDVNLRAAMQLGQAAVGVFLPKGRGHFLATVSMGGIMAMPGSAAYSASKAGLRAFLASLHAELAGTDVRVSGIYPSAVDTPMLRHEARHGGSPLNFIGEVLPVHEIADAYEKAFDTGRLEVYAPYVDSLSTRMTMLRPAAVPRLIRPLNWIGERGRAKFLDRIGDA